MSENYDKEISQKESELEILKSQMETIRLQFARDSASFIENFYKATTDFYITGKADVTLNLGKEKLVKMKEKIINLIKNAEQITADSLSSEEFWWHLRESEKFDTISAYLYSDNNPPKILDEAIRLIMGKIGVIFKEYGYFRPEELWLEYSTTNNQLPLNAKLRFPYSIIWSAEMKNTINKYNRVYEKARNLRNEINELILKRNINKAKELWDSL